MQKGTIIFKDNTRGHILKRNTKSRFPYLGHELVTFEIGHMTPGLVRDKFVTFVNFGTLKGSFLIQNI